MIITTKKYGRYLSIADAVVAVAGGDELRTAITDYYVTPCLYDYVALEDPFPKEQFQIERKAPRHKPAKLFPWQRKSYYGRR